MQLAGKRGAGTGKLTAAPPRAVQTMSASPYKQLEQEFKRLHAFRGALALLRSNAAVMMPRRSADGRGEQPAAMETEPPALLTAPPITSLLGRGQANPQGLPYWQIANLRE